VRNRPPDILQCSAGVSPAVFRRVPIGKTAGKMPALRNTSHDAFTNHSTHQDDRED
jgi:hypothetical protein